MCIHLRYHPCIHASFWRHCHGAVLSICSGAIALAKANMHQRTLQISDCMSSALSLARDGVRSIQRHERLVASRASAITGCHVYLTLAAFLSSLPGAFTSGAVIVIDVTTHRQPQRWHTRTLDPQPSHNIAASYVVDRQSCKPDA